MDFFKDINDIRNSFHKFAQNTAADGVLILNAAIEHPEEIIADLKERVVTFGLTEEADYSASDITSNEAACPSFTFLVRGQAAGHVTLNVPGRHNIANALAAIAFATEAGIDTDTIIRGLQAFGGTARRFEYKGKLGGITIIDDYAHHPTEIAATLTAARNYPHGRIICVFQPHTYTPVSYTHLDRMHLEKATLHRCQSLRTQFHGRDQNTAKLLYLCCHRLMGI